MPARSAHRARENLPGWLAALALAAAAGPACAQPTPSGPDFQVNTYTSGYQQFASVSADARGEFVVTWDSTGSQGNDNDGTSVQSQRFAADTTPLGPEIQVDTYVTGNQSLPAVATTAGAGFVVTWTSDGSPENDGSGFSIQARRFAGDGSPLGDQFQVNAYTTGHQFLASVAANGSGGFVIAWQGTASPGSDDDQGSVQARRFDSAGAPLGPEVQVNTYTTGNQGSVDVDSDVQGRFVVVWSSGASAGTDTDQESIHARRYASDGSPLDDEFQVNELTTGPQSDPGVAVAADGSFLVAWTHEGFAPTDFGYSIRARRYGADGLPIGPEFQVNSYSTGFQFGPSVAYGAGEFLVSWTGTQSPGNDHSDTSIQARRFTGDGTPLTDDFQVNTFAPSTQRRPDCTIDGSGGFVVTWQSLGSAGTDTSAASVQARRWDDPFVDGFESGDTSRWSSTSP